MKRAAMAGSTGTAVLAFLLVRGLASGPAPAANFVQYADAAAHSAGTRPSASVLKRFRTQWPDEGPWKASQAHFAGLNESNCPAVTQAASGKDTVKNKDARPPIWRIPSCEKVRAMIAIVPDPVQSSMALQFDRAIEAIQLSAQSLDYVSDRYWLPWHDRQKTESAGSPEAASEEGSKQRNQPGLLMFRWDGPADQPQATTLYVFLVGDLATSGINGAQFSTAVKYVQEVCGGKNSPDCGQSVRILGPTFSASLASLRRLADAAAPRKFVAYSGTVSSICAVANQGLPTGPEECPASKGSPAPQHLKLEFHLLIHGTEPILRSLKNILGRYDGDLHCGPRPDIAIFSEAATTYGRASREPEKREPENGGPCYIRFSYPREISSLRNAYTGKEPGVTPEQAESNGSPYLPFDLADQQSGRSDEPPDFSGQQGPLSKEAVLMSFAAELRRSRSKYIVITGSNVLDVLFLARFLRKSVPDARLVVLNSDLLFEREPDNAAYIGTMALTTYPFIGNNLEWTNLLQESRQPLPRLPFADQYEEGQYNAGLLAMENLMPELPKPPDPYEFREPFRNYAHSFNSKCALPLWLTAVGNGGYWPIRIITADQEPDCHAQPGAGPESTPPVVMKDADFSSAWKTIFMIVCALAGMHIGLMLTAIFRRPMLADFSLMGAGPEQRFLFINIASAVLAVTLGMLLAPLWRFGKVGKLLTLFEFIAPAIALCLFAACAYLYRDFRWAVRRQKVFKEPVSFGREVCFTILYVAVWVIAFAETWFWWGLLRDEPTHYGFFFAYRSVHLATGVSPLTPMLPLLAAVYCWGMLEVWRLRFHDQVRPKLGITGAFPGKSTEEPIAISVNGFFLGRNDLIALSLVYLTWLFLLPLRHPFAIFELPVFEAVYEAFFCLVVFLMLSCCFRLRQIWHNLKKLLAELDQSPVRLAFSRLNEYSSASVWQSGAPAIEWTNITRCREVMHQLVNCKPDILPEIKTAIGKAERAAEKTGVCREKLKSEPACLKRTAALHKLNIRFFRLQRQLGSLLQEVLPRLDAAWKTHDPIPAEDQPQDGETKKVAVDCETGPVDGETRQFRRMERFAALRYVAFIRGALSHMQRLVILIATLFSLALLSLNIFSFEPHQSLIWSFTAIFFVIGFTVVTVLMQAHRDHTLSRVTGTKPNELGMEFYVRMAIFGAGPLLTLLATQFPSIGRYLLSFLQPGLEALK